MSRKADETGRRAPPAALLRIPNTAALQLSTALNWLAVVSKGRLGDAVIQSIMAHHRITGSDPAVMIASAVQFLAMGADHQPDQLNRFWHIADQVSARERARYMNVKESELL